MSNKVDASFQVNSWDEKPFHEIDGGPKLTRASLTKTFRGDLEGEGTLEYLMIHGKDGVSSFMGVERVVGRLGVDRGVLCYSTAVPSRKTWQNAPGSSCLAQARGNSADSRVPVASNRPTRRTIP